jgi:hypothetical protein
MDLKDKKILNLVLYSKINIYGNEINYYESMYKILSDYYKNYKFVDTIFYLNDETINTDFELNNDILKIKGKETYIPGIIKKTINVFEWVKNNLDLNNYSYIVRSNISTIIEFNKFRKVITSNPFDYGSFYLFNLNQNLSSSLHKNQSYKTMYSILNFHVMMLLALNSQIQHITLHRLQTTVHMVIN